MDLKSRGITRAWHVQAHLVELRVLATGSPTTGKIPVKILSPVKPKWTSMGKHASIGISQDSSFCRLLVTSIKKGMAFWKRLNEEGKPTQRP